MEKFLYNCFLIITVLFATGHGMLVSAQPPVAQPRAPKPGKTTAPLPEPVQPPTSGWINVGRTERALKVDASVNLQLCVVQGTVKVNGWNRNEVRVFVEDGSPFTFKILEKSPKSGDPVWVSITGIEGKPKYQRPSECLEGGDIEI